MNELLREHFDDLLDQVLDSLPSQWTDRLNDVPLVVEDYPEDDIIAEFQLSRRDELCGLHDGIPLTERSVEDPADLPSQILIYREGIVAHTRDIANEMTDEDLFQQIRITVLHELGHHFGLDEGRLRELGYE